MTKYQDIMDLAGGVTLEPAVTSLPHLAFEPEQFDRAAREHDMRKLLKFVPFVTAAQNLSKDPSTQVGALAIDDDFNIRATGYNGFPRGVEDKPELYNNRPAKYLRITHAELNLICQAARTGVSLKDCTVILSALYPCPQCAGALIQAGIKRILVPDVVQPERWATTWVVAQEMLGQAGVKVFAYDLARDQKLREVI